MHNIEHGPYFDQAAMKTGAQRFHSVMAQHGIPLGHQEGQFLPGSHEMFPGASARGDRVSGQSSVVGGNSLGLASVVTGGDLRSRTKPRDPSLSRDEGHSGTHKPVQPGAPSARNSSRNRKVNSSRSLRPVGVGSASHLEAAMNPPSAGRFGGAHLEDWDSEREGRESISGEGREAPRPSVPLSVQTRKDIEALVGSDELTNGKGDASARRLQIDSCLPDGRVLFEVCCDSVELKKNFTKEIFGKIARCERKFL
jgi:hypothetical protein